MKAPRPHSNQLDDRSPTGLYPNLINPDTLCHKLTPYECWNIYNHGVVVRYSTSYEIAYLEKHTHQYNTEVSHWREHLSLGPPFTHSRESVHEKPHPRCLPPQRIFLTSHEGDQAKHRPGLSTGPQPTNLIKTGKPAAQRLCYQRAYDL